MSELPTLDRARVLDPALRGRADLLVPPAELLDLPERAVQFGTGAFLRGFVDPFLDEANRRGLFGGRVVAVGSTGSGRDAVLNGQDGLYTLVVRGLVGGEPAEEQRVIASVSRAVSARSQWDEVLALARSPELELVFSNTTEVGIALDEEDAPDLDPPRSFPGKLTRFLLERARAFDHDPARGVVVLPCELIERNGDRLRAIVLALAARWGLEEAFVRWVEEAVPFCNTLVDRIVPGSPDGAEAERLQARLGYRDAMLTVAEPYRLFAIEGDEALRDRLRFAAADPGILVVADIEPYRQRKVRLLNGAHTAMVPLALLAGCRSVADAVADERLGRFLRRVLYEELAPGLEVPGAEAFAGEVLERFANPFVRHALFDITLQGTMKMRVRVVPSILRYAERAGHAPPTLALAFAAYLLFLRGDLQEERRAAGLPVPPDDQGARVRSLWLSRPDAGATSLAALVRTACASADLWGADLTRVPGFVDAVTGSLRRLLRDGIVPALEAHLASPVGAE